MTTFGEDCSNFCLNCFDLRLKKKQAVKVLILRSVQWCGEAPQVNSDQPNFDTVMDEWSCSFLSTNMKFWFIQNITNAWKKNHAGLGSSLNVLRHTVPSCLLKVSWSGTDVTESNKRFQYLTTLHAKLFLLQENLSSSDASRSIWLYMIFWVRTKSFIIVSFFERL